MTLDDELELRQHIEFCKMWLATKAKIIGHTAGPDTYTISSFYAGELEWAWKMIDRLLKEMPRNADT